MTVNKGSLVSGRVAVTDYANLTPDRYQFLGLTQAEPNLGPGADNSVLVITTNNTRSWSNLHNLPILNYKKCFRSSLVFFAGNINIIRL